MRGPSRGRGRTHALVDVQLEFLLRDALLHPLAEGGVARGPDAALAVLDEAAALAVARGGGGGGGGPFPAVLLCAKAVHLPAPGRPLWGRVPRRPLRSRAPRGAGCRGPRTRGSQSPSAAEALPCPATGRPGSAPPRSRSFGLRPRVSAKPLPPRSRPRGRLLRLAGPRRESPGGAFCRGPLTVTLRRGRPRGRPRKQPLPEDSRPGLAGGSEGPRRLPPYFGCRANSPPGSSPGVARPPRAGPGLEPAASGPRGASGPPHPCSRSAAPRVPRQPLGRPAAARPTLRTTTVRSPALRGTAEVPPPRVHWPRSHSGRGRRRRWRVPLGAIAASPRRLATSWTLLGWVQSRESGRGKSSPGEGGEPGRRLSGPGNGWLAGSRLDGGPDSGYGGSLSGDRSADVGGDAEGEIRGGACEGGPKGDRETVMRGSDRVKRKDHGQRTRRPAG